MDRSVCITRALLIRQPPLREAHATLANATPQAITSSQAHYRSHELTSAYSGVVQCWLLILPGQWPTRIGCDFSVRLQAVLWRPIFRHIHRPRWHGGGICCRSCHPVTQTPRKARTTPALAGVVPSPCYRRASPRPAWRVPTRGCCGNGPAGYCRGAGTHQAFGMLRQVFFGRGSGGLCRSRTSPTIVDGHCWCA